MCFSTRMRLLWISCRRDLPSILPGRHLPCLVNCEKCLMTFQPFYLSPSWLYSPPLPLYYRVGWDWAVAFMPFGKHWQRHSAVICRITDSAASERYSHVNTREAHALLHNLLETPENFYQNVKECAQAFPVWNSTLIACLPYSYVSSSILMITYGHEGSSSLSVFSDARSYPA